MTLHELRRAFESLLGRCGALVAAVERGDESRDLAEKCSALHGEYQRLRTAALAPLHRVQYALQAARPKRDLDEGSGFTPHLAAELERFAATHCDEQFVFLEMPWEMVPFYTAWGDFHFRRGETDAALAAWDHVLAIHPESPLVRERLGSAGMRPGS